MDIIASLADANTPAIPLLSWPHVTLPEAKAHLREQLAFVEHVERATSGLDPTIEYSDPFAGGRYRQPLSAFKANYLPAIAVAILLTEQGEEYRRAKGFSPRREDVRVHTDERGEIVGMEKVFGY